ncbi:hypothetical protein HYZ05_03330 [Candidatus Daviesbacteria bacterium]|nr:hypothetical protein [Candidatus Daviesbacteria bacterium]
MIRSQILLLGFILLLSFFFRTYQVVERFEFAHDGDLYSWIVKDIVINHHPRLIGQLTSAPGIYIGPIFYYLLIPFFMITRMDPIGAALFAILLGLTTTISYYWVFSRIFKKGVGLIGAFLYAVLLTSVGSDRWVVPTITTSLWAVWYFYTLIMLSRGKFYIFWLLGILIGLIWHIHIALIPTLLAVPAAIFLSRKIPNFKQISIFLISLFITSIPLILFEFKHNFIQTLSLIENFTFRQEGGPTGFYRIQLVLGMITKNINQLLFAPNSFNLTNNLLFTAAFLLSGILLIKTKLISFKETVSLYAWIIGPILFFSLSSAPVSEYYFTNTNVMFIAGIALAFYYLLRRFKKEILVLALLLLIPLKNFYFLTTQNYYNKGYLEKKSVVDFIVDDARVKKFPCFSINYITSFGENTGFRYFFYLKNAHIAVAGRGSPVYSIVIPDEYAKAEVKVKFGHIGVITPQEIPSHELMKDACSGANTNITDPLFGYVE